MIAGSETSNGAASSLTDRSGSRASRITSARRVGSDSAAKVQSSGELETLTMWLSIAPSGIVSTGPTTIFFRTNFSKGGASTLT
jgi:hypothetical protein